MLQCAQIHEEAQRRAEIAVAERLAAAEAAAGAAAVQSVAVAKLEAETRSERAKKCACIIVGACYVTEFNTFQDILLER